MTNIEGFYFCYISKPLKIQGFNLRATSESSRMDTPFRSNFFHFQAVSGKMLATFRVDAPVLEFLDLPQTRYAFSPYSLSDVRV